MERTHLDGTWQKERSFSPAVVIEGGPSAQKIIYVAGHGSHVGENGESLSGDFEGQTRRAFALLAETLGRAGATLSDMVTMTVFINDGRYGTRFTEIRGEHFPHGRYPASALITVSGFAKPEMMVEIQGIAVTG